MKSAWLPSFKAESNSIGTEEVFVVSVASAVEQDRRYDEGLNEKTKVGRADLPTIGTQRGELAATYWVLVGFHQGGISK